MLVRRFLNLRSNTERGQSWCSGTRADCKTDWFWVRSPLDCVNILNYIVILKIWSTMRSNMSNTSSELFKLYNKYINNFIITVFVRVPFTLLSCRLFVCQNTLSQERLEISSWHLNYILKSTTPWYPDNKHSHKKKSIFT